ncbi:MAG TPA: phosphatidylinositol mannoside acyltransferase [Acidimicrobiia bacterium]|nr:phosphatidylinositol mannoside acyltransferase [Acidimicrobiia bacterium]
MAVEGAPRVVISSRLAYPAYRAGAGIARALPEPVANALARRAARTLGAVQRDQRRLVTRHMRRVHGGDLQGLALQRAVRAVYESYGRYFAELFRLGGESLDEIRDSTTSEGLEHLEAAYAKGNGVILAIPHLGGWDYGGAWIASLGYEPLAVAERLEPPELFEWFVDVRRRLGIEVVPADGDAGTAVLAALKAGRLVGLVSDRDVLGNGVEVEFFGERTTLPAGPATLALRTGAALLAGAIYFTGRDGHHAVIRPPLAVEREGRLRDDVTRVTQMLAAELETLIRRAPEQWHMMQPNWPSDLDGSVR